MAFAVFDKADWYPGDELPDHLRQVLEWLDGNSLLSEDGSAELKEGPGPDFALTTESVTADGALVLRRAYADWLKSAAGVKRPSMELLEAALREFRGA